MRLVLVIPPSQSAAHEQRIALREEGFDVGGAADCDAVIDHPTVGTARVRLERRGEHWVVIDREGRGMCSVGGLPLQPREARIVRPPHQLRLGEIDIELAFDPSDSESEPGATREVALRAAEFVAEVAPAQPRVRVVEGPRMGEMLELAHAGPFRVGRAKSCDLFLESEDASREHFAIERQSGRVIVKDLGSARGTFLGRTRLEPHRGAVWDPSRMIRAAEAVFSLEMATDTAAERLLAPLACIADDTPLDAPVRAEPVVIAEPLDPSPAEPLLVPASVSELASTTSSVPEAVAASRARTKSRIDPTFAIVVLIAVIGILALGVLVALAAC